MVGFGVIAAAGFYFTTKLDVSALRNLSISIGIYLASVFGIAGVVQTLFYHAIFADQGRKVSSLRLLFVLLGSSVVDASASIAVGIPTRLLLFWKVVGVSVAEAGSAVAFKNVVEIGVLAALAVISTVCLLPLAQGTLGTQTLLRLAILSLSPFLSVGGILVYLSKSEHPPKILLALRSQKINLYWAKLHNSIAHVKIRTIALGVSMYALREILRAIGTVVVLRDLGVRLGFMNALFYRVVSNLAGLVSLIPLGLGIRDITGVFILSRFGVAESIGVTVVLVERAFWTVLPLLVGLGSISILGVNALLKRQNP